MNAQVIPDRKDMQGDLLSAFEALTLDPAQFSHRRHLEFGWRYLQRYGFPQGAAKFCERLRGYVAHVGAAAKYHETITWAYLVLMNEERTLRSAPGETFDALLARRPDLLDHRGGALSKIYEQAQLDQADSRRVFQLPRRAAGVA
jgi:hypothetical protein